MISDRHKLFKSKTTPIQAGWTSSSRDVIPYEHFDYETLEDAVAVIQGKSEDYRFEEDGTLHVLNPKKIYKDAGKHFEGFTRITNDFSADRLQTIQAVTAILANIALRQDRASPVDGSIEITAHPPETGKRGVKSQEMYKKFRAESTCDPDDDEVPAHLVELLKDIGPSLTERVEDLESDLQSLKDGTAVTMGHYRDDYAGAALLGQLVHEVQSLREEKSDDEIWRMHNTHPDAVNFYFAAQEAEFLLERDGPPKRINNIAPFINSYWPQLAGKIDLKVEPSLLAHARSYLKHVPLREDVNELNAG